MVASPRPPIERRDGDLTRTSPYHRPRVNSEDVTDPIIVFGFGDEIRARLALVK